MPDLLHSLQNHDLGHLHIVAGLWGLELTSNETNAAAKELAASLLDPGLVRELIESLTTDARRALDALAIQKGRIPWAVFVRKFGDVREMGPGRRDRERPHLNPASAAEALFYRALLARAFFDTPSGPQEFAYIPEDLLSLIKHKGHEGYKEKTFEPLGRAATPAERAYVIPAKDYILDEATSLLAALRLWRELPPDRPLLDLLSAANLLRDGVPQTEAVKTFLEAPRGEALKMLDETWRASEIFNELRQLPGLFFEGEWRNQPLATRRFLLNLLEAIPEGRWWSLAAFVHAVKQKYPDFQRPAGDYDSWFIKRASDGEYLRGFAHWDEVDGALIRFFITSPLHRLGMVDLATPKQGVEPSAFRRVQSRVSVPEDAKSHISSQGRISMPRLAPRAARYQIARFCEWEEERPDEYRYRITAQSLGGAKEQGLKVEHLLALLARHAETGIPPLLVKALKRWEANGTEARMETQVVLRVSRPETLEELRNSKAARFLGEPLGPTAVMVKAGAQSKVLTALAEMGLLAEDLTAHVAVPGDEKPTPRTAQRAK